jgi:UDP-glucose 4-epimerase
VAIFCQKILSNSESLIFGDGEQTRDFVAVQDVAQANALALDPSLNGLYNIGTGVETSVNDLFRILAELAGNNISPKHAPARKGELQRSVIDPQKFQKITSWKPEMPLNTGLNQTYEFFSGHVNS